MPIPLTPEQREQLQDALKIAQQSQDVYQWALTQLQRLLKGVGFDDVALDDCDFLFGSREDLDKYDVDALLRMERKTEKCDTRRGRGRIIPMTS